ncbi:MAG: prolipoprotein diacylglyceryl transferase, partial [Coriobacteriales bacterium]|nr:prolipoprotein diacylglyceryl transferase [Coriobacteriales bacterium]
MLNEIYQAIDTVIFSIGPISLRCYGLAYLLGFICCVFYLYRLCKRFKLNFEIIDVISFVCFSALGMIICARLGYCLFYTNGYCFTHPEEIIMLNHGGMSFHGGLCGIAIVSLIYGRVIKVPCLTLLDLASIVAPIGLFFGRCANFINGELYGAVTDLAIGVDFTGSGTLYHPSQLYEAALEGIVLFLILFIMSRKKPPFSRGIYSGTFLILYACFRIIIEFVRLPDVQIGYFFGSWGTMGQALSLPLLILGIILIIYAIKTKHEQRLFSSDLSATNNINK